MKIKIGPISLDEKALVATALAVASWTTANLPQLASTFPAGWQGGISNVLLIAGFATALLSRFQIQSTPPPAPPAAPAPEESK